MPFPTPIDAYSDGVCCDDPETAKFKHLKYKNSKKFTVHPKTQTIRIVIIYNATFLIGESLDNFWQQLCRILR